MAEPLEAEIRRYADESAIAEIAEQRRQSQVDMTLDFCRKALDELNLVLGIMEDRLQSLVHPSGNDEVAVPSFADAGEMVPLPREILHVAEKINGQAIRVGDLLRRLEV